MFTHAHKLNSIKILNSELHRFGTKGLAITFVSDESDAKTLNEVQERFEVDITELPDEIDLSSYIEGR